MFNILANIAAINLIKGKSITKSYFGSLCSTEIRLHVHKVLED